MTQTLLCRNIRKTYYKKAEAAVNDIKNSTQLLYNRKIRVKVRYYCVLTAGHVALLSQNINFINCFTVTADIILLRGDRNTKYL